MLNTSDKIVIKKYYTSRLMYLDSKYIPIQDAVSKVLSENATIVEHKTNKDITVDVLLKYVRNGDSLTDIELRLEEVKAHLNK